MTYPLGYLFLHRQIRLVRMETTCRFAVRFRRTIYGNNDLNVGGVPNAH
jgi:hypothetical protein